MKHRINNTEWMMKWWWNRGNANPSIERMLNVFDLHFSTPEEKAVSRICASKTGEICKHLANAYNSNSHARGLHYLTFVCGNKAGKFKATGRVVLRTNVSEKLSVINPLWMRRSPFASWIHQHLPPKNHNLFVKFGSKKELEKKGICDHQLIMEKYSTQGRGVWSGWGGGAAAPFHSLFMNQAKICKRYDNMRNT